MILGQNDQNLQNIILRNQNLTWNLIDALYKATKVTNPKKLRDIIKNYLKRCADFAMALGKINHYLLSLKRKSIIPNLDIAYKCLPFPQGEHPKLLLGDDLPKGIKELTETNNVSQCLFYLNKCQQYIPWKFSK